jgi:hypothetical protein
MDITRAGVNAEVHIYQKGRHGFGAAAGTEFEGWVPAFESFLKQSGFIPGGKL